MGGRDAMDARVSNTSQHGLAPICFDLTRFAGSYTASPLPENGIWFQPLISTSFRLRCMATGGYNIYTPTRSMVAAEISNW